MTGPAKCLLSLQAKIKRRRNDFVKGASKMHVYFLERLFRAFAAGKRCVLPVLLSQLDIKRAKVFVPALAGAFYMESVYCFRL